MSSKLIIALFVVVALAVTIESLSPLAEDAREALVNYEADYEEARGCADLAQSCESDKCCSGKCRKTKDGKICSPL